MSEEDLRDARQREQALASIPQLIADIDYKLQGEEIMHFQLRATLHRHRSELEALRDEYGESFGR